MFRPVQLSVVLAFIAIGTCLSFTPFINKMVSDDIYNYGELSTLLEINPFGKTAVKGLYSYSYTIGTCKDGGLLAESLDSWQWDEPQNTTLVVQYQHHDYITEITCVQLNVNQSSNIGKAYTMTGGAGQDSITYAVDANGTYWFTYFTRIFGKTKSLS